MGLLLEGTKARILDLLRLRPLSAKEVAEALGISRAAAFRHLQDLEALGLVRFELRGGGGRGRPHRLYFAADPEAPYAALCAQVLEALEALLGREGVVDLLKEGARAQLQGLGLRGLPLRERLLRLARFLKSRGYEAELWEEGGVLYLLQRRCPRLALSQSHPALCQGEHRAYEEALGLPLVQEARIAEGAEACRYRVALE